MRCLAYRMSFFLMVLAGLAAVAPARAQTPAAIAGVMTRWQMSSKTACQHSFDGYADEPECPRSSMFTITPDLAGLTLRVWLKTLASAGVNTGVIFLMPGYKLAATPAISQTEWDAYDQYLYLPPGSLTAAQKQVILAVGEAISKRQYTVAQRNAAVLAFLTQLQKAFPGGMPVRFMLDERVWFISHLNAQGKPISLSSAQVFFIEQAYADDIAGVVRMAGNAGLSRWLIGARLSEYAAKNWNLMGPVMVDLVTLINARTSGWMKSHIFIGAGGGWGQDWTGVNAMRCPATSGWRFKPCTGAFPFFKYMNPQVGYFAFGDKFMEFGKPEQYMLNGKDSGWMYTYITGEITDFCKQNTAKYKCRNPVTPDVTDWEAFLEDDIEGLGFTDLISFMQQNATEYPRLANVIFDGDSSDSTATMTLPVAINGAAAIANLFRDAMQGGYQNIERNTTTTRQNLGSWTGKIFLNGFDDKSTVPRPSFYGDSGLSMFDTNYDDFTFAPVNVQVTAEKVTTGNWRLWP